MRLFSTCHGGNKDGENLKRAQGRGTESAALLRRTWGSGEASEPEAEKKIELSWRVLAGSRCQGWVGGQAISVDRIETSVLLHRKDA